MKRVYTLALVLASLSAPNLSALDLVSKETIDSAKAATGTYRLRNRIPVFVRQVPHSDIFEVTVTSLFGHRESSSDKKSLNSLMFAVMPRATKTYNKDQVFDLTEKYSYIVNCSAGFEYSNCGLSTVNDFWKDGVKLLGSIITEPKFDQADIELIRDRLNSNLKSSLSDPENESGDLADNLYYPPNHPYRSTLSEKMSSLTKIKLEDLQAAHKQYLNADRMAITVVTSLPAQDIVKELNAVLGDIPSQEFKRTEIPEINLAKATTRTSFTPREIPTGYITIRYNAPSAKDPSSDGFRLLTRIMNEILFVETRVKRSLSYSTFSTYSPLEIGVAEISSTTSKPKETLTVIQSVMDRLRKQELTRAELEEHRNVYATTFFLTQEEHSSLASSLIGAWVWLKNPTAAYEFPRRMSIVTMRDLRNLADKWFRNVQVSVVYAKSKFKTEWSESFAKAFVPPKKKARKKAKK